MKLQVSTTLRVQSVSIRVVVVLCGLLGITPFVAVAQAQDTIKEALQQGPLMGVTTPTQNPLQIALLHWYDANQTTAFAVGANPAGVAFDGADIWVPSSWINTVSKL